MPLRPKEVHTLVLWSKDYSRLLADRELRAILDQHDQLFAHFTVTGLGGSRWEPGVPPWEIAILQLPDLIGLCGSPERVVVRFDPIVHWHDGSRIKSNLPFAEPLFERCSRAGIQDIRVSFATLYGKILRRKVNGYDPSAKEKSHIAAQLLDIARIHGVRLTACSDPSLEQAGILRSPCIDGTRLTRLHPRREIAPRRRDRGQRANCLCTESVDIGSYSMRCPGGCLYCYANPQLPRPPA